jgi:hypothetical protein
MVFTAKHNTKVRMNLFMTGRFKLLWQGKKLFSSIVDWQVN